MTLDDRLAALRKVHYLAGLDDDALREVSAHSRAARYRPGELIIGELEAGTDVYVIAAGTVEVSVEPEECDRFVLGQFGPGFGFGEMSSLTGELHSASVNALTDVELLILSDAYFHRLRARRPEVAVALVKLLGARLATSERTIDELLDDQAWTRPKDGAALAHARRGSIVRAWRELVVNRRRDLGFLALSGFLATLLCIRAIVYLSFRFDVLPADLLRTAYLSGFALLGLSALSALLTFRLPARRVIALAYGIACALIFNELGLTLAFDIFFKDIHTADPSVPFDIERLYRRTEPLRAIVIGLVVLVQAAYLRRFYRRAGFVIATRARKLWARVRFT